MTREEKPIESTNSSDGKEPFVGKDGSHKTRDTTAGEREAVKNNRTAILLLDFQNEFVKKGGLLHDDVAGVMEKTRTLENAAYFLEFARKKDAMIIYSPVVMKEDEAFASDASIHSDRVVELSWENDSSSTRKQQRLKRQSSIESLHSGKEYQNMVGLFTENTWNCEFCHEIAPHRDDKILMDRIDFSAFAGTKLELLLQMNSIDHLFVMGFLTNICVYQTSMDAIKLFPNMSTYVVADACAAKSMDEHTATLQKIAKTSAVNVVSRAEAEQVLQTHAESSKSSSYDGSDDQWLLIDKIFAVADLNKNGNLSIEELRSMEGSMPSITSLVSILSENIGKDGCVSKESMYNILFERKPRKGWLEWIPMCILMYIIPLCYSISTRLPFIFVALEIFEARQGTLAQVSWVLGVYQTSRALGNLLIVVFGGKNPFQRLEILQVLCGLGGWLWLALYQRDNATSYFCGNNCESSIMESGGETQPIWPLFGLFFVGLGETIVNLQRSIMRETGDESPSGIIDDTIMAGRLSMQYSFVALGSIVAYVFGGWTYSRWGYTAVCEIGVLVQIVQLVGAVIYLSMARHSKKELKEDDLDGNDLIRCIIYQFQMSLVVGNYAKEIARGIDNADDNGQSGGLATAARRAKNDRILNHSLREIYRFYFTKERDDITAMEHLLASVDNTETGLASKRPEVVAVGKNKLSKLVLYLMKKEGGGSLSEREFVSYWGPRVYLSMFESSSAATVPIVWPYMKAVVLTQALAALCIGVFLSTALLSYNQRFGLNTARVGTLLGIGEGIGMVVILLKEIIPRMIKSKTNDKHDTKLGIFKAILARPLNVPFILFVASAASILFSVDNLVFAVICQIFFSGVNDLSVSLMNELIGTSLPAEDFRFYQGIGQWLRRLGNMVTAILGPLLFQINDAFPFVFFGLIVFAWACVLWILMFLHANKMSKVNQTFSGPEDNMQARSWLLKTPLGLPFVPFAETARIEWQVLEQRYYAQDKESIEEELRSWKAAQVDISLMETRLRTVAAALEIEKDQRRALEDRMNARVLSVSAKFGKESVEKKSI